MSDSYREKVQLITENTHQAVTGYLTGFYLHGRGGIGKSYNVIRELERHGKYEGNGYQLHGGRLSAAALFEVLMAHPDEPHLLEDIEDLFSDRTCLDLMRMALGGQEDRTGVQERIIKYAVKDGKTHERRCRFTGSLIFTGNTPIEAIPELGEAVRSRIRVQYLEVTREEMLEVMHGICAKGKQTGKGFAPAKICQEVLTQYIQLLKPDTQLDLRVLNKLILTRLACEQLKLKTPFSEFVRQEVAQSTESQQPMTRSQRVSKERDIAIELKRKGLTGDPLLKEWKQRTGHDSVDSYYRRLK